MSETIIDLGVGKIFTRIGTDLSRLVRAEVELAKREIRDDLAKAIRAGVAAAVAMMAGYVFLIFISLAAMFGLGAVMPLGWAALIVAAVWAVVAAVLLARARAAAKEMTGVKRATQMVKEDVEWAKTQAR